MLRGEVKVPAGEDLEEMGNTPDLKKAQRTR
jgi:hypothetical protein